MLTALLLLLVGFVILIKGADFLVKGAASAAKRNGISNLAIGLTVVAFGTSMPELIVSLLSALDGKTDAAFGNVIGSNNINLLLTLGVAGLIYPLVVQQNTIRYEVPLSLLAACVLFLLVNDSMTGSASGTNALNRFDSGILLILFTGFVFYIYRNMRNNTELTEEESIVVLSTPLSVGMVLLGSGMLVGGGKLVVDNAIHIAKYFNMSEKMIGLTILAAGTSLPELATSCVAAYRKNTDIAIGNVIGSNIFNIFLILGLTGLITPLPYNTAFNFDIYVLIGSTILLIVFMFTLGIRKLDRWEALIFILMYLAYTTYVITNDASSNS